MPPDPKSALLSFPLDIGIDQNADPETVQPYGERPRVVSSVNTRLTTVRGRVAKAPARTVLATGLSRCGGIVPSRVYDSAASFFFPQDGGNRRVAGGVVGALTATNSDAGQNSFYPLRVNAAGSLPSGATSYQTPAMCYDASTGYSYHASLVDVAGGSSAIVVTVIDDSGRLVVTPARVEIFAGTAPLGGRFVALSAHAAGVVRIWYRAPGTNQIIARALTITGLTLVIGAPNVVFTPSSAAYQSIAIAYDAADTSNIYMICFTAAGTDARLLRINPVTMAVATGLDVVTGATGSAVHGIAYVHDGSAGRLIWMVSWTGGNCSLFEANTTTLATIWSQTNRMWDGMAVSCGFMRTSLPTTMYQCVFAVSKVGSVATSSSPAGTQVEFRAVNSGGLLAATEIPWYGLVGQIVTHKTQPAIGWYPLFPVQVLYDGSFGRYDPTSPNFVSDPSVEVMLPHFDSFTSLIRWNPVARVGSDACVRYPSHGVQVVGCNSFIPAGSRVRLMYLAENLVEGATALGYVPRYVDIGFGVATRSCLLPGGQAVVAGALPVVWDGAEITEFMPLRAPKLFGSATGGVGTPLTGTYRFAVVVSWKDASGQIHRSPPSNIVTLTPAGTAVQLFVTRPVSYRNGLTQDKVTYTIYASQDGGITLYAQIAVESLPATSNYWANFRVIGTPVQNALTPALYSTGGATEMKISYAPNAARDAKVIGDRLWLIDAERNRAYYSQPMTTEALAGVFPAMNPTQYVDFPAAAGTVIALENWKETPLFFSSTGVWTVDGEGPDALNNPPFFSQPRQLSELPCTDGDSVLATPVGVLFRCRNRFAIVGDGGGVLDDANANVDIVGAVVFRDQHEVVVVAENGTAFVFNYLKQAWTTWNTTVFESFGEISAVAQDPWTGDAIYFSAGASVLSRIDPDTTSTLAQMSISTGWVIPGNPQEDCTLQNWILRAANAGPHALSLAVAVDYQANQPAKLYNAAEINAATTNGRYDLWAEPRDVPARAVRLTITETGATGPGAQPINVTYELIRNAGKKASSLRQSGRK